MRTKWVLAVLMLSATFAASGRAQQVGDKAQGILAETRKAIGGRKVDAVTSLSVQAATQRNVGSFQMTSDVEMFVELPDKYVKSEVMSGGPMPMTTVTGFNGQTPIKSSGPGGIASGGAMIIRIGPGPAGPSGGDKPTPEQQQQIDDQLLRSARQEISRLMLGWFGSTHPSVDVQYSYAGDAESADGRASMIDVRNADGFRARLFVDQKTHLPLMVTYQGPQPRVITSGGPRPAVDGESRRQMTDEERKKAQADAQKQLEELQKQPPAMVEYALYFDDWREVDGIQFPYSLRRAVGGTTTEEWTVRKVRVNAKIDPKKFQAAQ